MYEREREGGRIYGGVSVWVFVCEIENTVGGTLTERKQKSLLRVRMEGREGERKKESE